MAPLYQGDRTAIESLILPKIINDMVIPARSNQPVTSLALTRCNYTGSGRQDCIPNFESNADVYDEKTGHLLFKLSGLRYAQLDVSADVHKSHSYLQSSWKPDVTLLSETKLDAISLDGEDTVLLEQELDLSKPAVKMLALVKHKLASPSILEIDIESRGQGDKEPLLTPKSPDVSLFSSYVYVTKSPDNLKQAQKRIQHRLGTSFFIYDIHSIQEVPREKELKFDLVIIKAASASASQLSTAIDKAKSLVTAHGFVLLTKLDVFRRIGGWVKWKCGQRLLGFFRYLCGYKCEEW